MPRFCLCKYLNSCINVDKIPDNGNGEYVIFWIDECYSMLKLTKKQIFYYIMCPQMPS